MFDVLLLMIVAFVFIGTASGTLGSTVTSYRDYISKSAQDRDNVITFDTVWKLNNFVFSYFT